MQSAGLETISDAISANLTLPLEKSVWEVKFFLSFFFFYYYLLGKRDFGYRIRLQPWKIASRFDALFWRYLGGLVIGSGEVVRGRK